MLEKIKKKNFSISYIIASILILGSIAIVCVFIYVGSTRALTTLENIFFQIFILLASIVGSYLLGNIISRNSKYDSIRPHSRSAFRRVLSLYAGLGRLGKAVEDEIIKDDNSSIKFGKIKAIIIEQIATADDALEDWRDIVPDEVAEIEQKFKEKNNLIQKGSSNNEK